MPDAPVDQPAVLTLLATSVGRPVALGRANGTTVLSAIAKQPATAATLHLDALNLTGDDQADRTVHGGVDKSVYAYPSEHAAWWRHELGVELGPAGMGENLTTAGLDEHDVHLGDRFRWGDALVEVSQPRSPCFKLALHLGRPDVLKAMTRSARSGWYLRTIEPGAVPTTGELVRTRHDPHQPTVHQVFSTSFSRDPDLDLLDRILRSPHLADQWADALGGRRG
ncbi:MOSC domain-containing protein [soil metagenome]